MPYYLGQRNRDREYQKPHRHGCRPDATRVSYPPDGGTCFVRIGLLERQRREQVIDLGIACLLGGDE